MSEEKEILVVEDQANYLAAAQTAFGGKNAQFVRNYDDALEGIAGADEVVTDVYFPQNSLGTDRKISEKALERIKFGLVKDFVGRFERRVEEETGISPNEKLRGCYETLGYHGLGDSGGLKGASVGRTNDAIIRYIQVFGEEAPGKLKVILREMYIEKSAQRILDGMFTPLRDYMAESCENQPLGYLVAEEAERLGKPFVMVTSLRHSQPALVPILRSAKARGWNLLEGGHGSKEDPEFWRMAFLELSAKGRRKVK